MIYIFYTLEHGQIDTDSYEKLWGALPQHLQQAIAVYKKPMDRQLRLLGKLLLRYALNHLGFNPLTLYNYFTDSSNKPGLKGIPVHFSISHSGSIAVCALSTTQNIGADVEKIMPVDVARMMDHFEPGCRQLILSSRNMVKAFYEQWTMREAAIKASGMGMPHVDMAAITADRNRLKINNILYYHYTNPIAYGYILSLASDTEIHSPTFCQVSLNDLTD